MTGLALFIRAVHLGALTLLVGAFAFLLLVARPAFTKGGMENSPTCERFDRLLLHLARWSLLVVFVSALVWLAVQAAIVSGQPWSQGLTLDTVGSLLTGTEFGRVWQFRLALMALLGGFLLFRERERDRRDWIALRLERVILGGGVTAALAWAGHLAATEGMARPFHLAADSIHLLAAGVWLGGLLPLFLLLTSAKRSLDPSWAAVAREATRRFSTLGLISISSLTLTGVVNAWILVGGFPQLIGTPYGRLLLLKLGLLLSLVGIAAVNLLRLKPRLLAPSTSASVHALPELVRRLTRNLLAEVCLGAAILLIVGALGVTPPARHIPPSWPFSFRLSWEAVRDLPGVRLQVLGGGLLALWGLLALGYAGFRHRSRRPALGLGLIGVASGLWVMSSATAIDAYPTTYLRPAIPYQALSVANGLRLYRQHCVLCHGVAGYGDGPAAAGLVKKPADLTAKHSADHTAGDLFWWLTYGIRGSPMPAFKENLNEEERWDLINFLRALAATERARPLSPVVERPWLVAPDFAYGIGVGEERSLKAQRGQSIVLLVLATLPQSRARLEQLDQYYIRLRGAGADVLTVPVGGARGIYRIASFLPVVTDGIPEIIETYGLFRRTFASAALPPIPSHMEFLIDRQGYIRARWIPGEGSGWASVERLLAEVDRLNREPSSVPAPDEHVH